jgi:uncharacterized protein YndB with AHSA1/START domain
MKDLTTTEKLAEQKAATGSKFVYVTYIRTTAEKLWDALIKPEFTKQYWCACWQESEWTVGATWKLVRPDGTVCDAGEVLEVDRPKRLVVKWRNEFRPELTVEGFSRCTFDLEPTDDSVKLTITHEIDCEKSKLIDAVSNGWPKILASLKSLLETGESLVSTRQWPKGF